MPALLVTRNTICFGILLLVPSARLELAQLSPLPPQDSVSTNFTTTAVTYYLFYLLRNVRFGLRGYRSSRCRLLSFGRLGRRALEQATGRC